MILSLHETYCDDVLCTHSLRETFALHLILTPYMHKIDFYSY